MRLHTLVAAVGAALILSGCVTSRGLEPQGQLSDPSTLHADRSLAKAQVSPANWPAADWWTGLGDSQLDALIAEALKGNPDLAVAEARVRQAQAQSGAADAARDPTFGVGGGIAGARLPGTLLPPPTGNHFGWTKYGYGNFSWDLDLWGGKRDAWEAAVGAQRASEIDARAARIEISTNVARAYVQLGYAFTQLDVAKAELERSQASGTLTRQRVAAGVDNQIQVKQADSEIATAEREVAVAERAIDSSRSALSVLLGKGPDRGLDIARPAALAPSAVAVPANLPADLLGHRADLVAARWRVEAASKNIAAAKTEFLPNVSLGILAAQVAPGSENLFSARARFAQILPAFSLPIFDGGRLRANLAGKDADYDLAVAQYNKILVGALNEVSDDLSALDSTGTQIAAQQRAQDAAQQAYDLSQQRYKAGVGSYLESLIVRQQLLQAEQRMAALRAQQVDTSVQLIQALGGGFRPEAGDQPVAAATPANN
ncbi:MULTISPECIES: efflux transporter outer membrane subunit [unclassified Luteibacter]|uniref:efflux transporter outer membrane subunit n=1 Tax=unclassified Luteibacter TaxID=2620188 RepID=UPI0008BB23DB|nr:MULTISPECIES: efflux transporter outer membrane subunit [unclassified Luteibacter]SEO36703.1 efflux transporter, outer membrane factor (OMF) lipoprotein, NodT family [Luteibacter sp. UNC138MFCol5.1]SEW23264.1 efflux transporter, outer membrane factor (OMF) lipoprotein, NodT family [Luteibacter sp. 329MFSha]